MAYRFETDSGYQLEVMTYGATILRYVTPDKAGNFANVILGFDDFDSYVGNSPKHGASVGPVAGRIAGATFELNGKTYDLEVNNASNCNHSGSTGWDSSLFELTEVSDHGLTSTQSVQTGQEDSLAISRSGSAITWKKVVLTKSAIR